MQEKWNATLWKDLSLEEMKAFIGIVLAMGLVRLPKMKDYWRKTCKILYLPTFSDIMPRNRFLQIYRYLHVSDDEKQIPRGEKMVMIPYSK